MTATPTSTSTSTEPAVNQPDPANPSAPPALRMVDVRKVYGSGDGEVVALDHAALEVARDEIVALVGPSGSGKTTLCSIAGGLLHATDGAVEVDGRDITHLSPSELTDFRRSSVGFVFQK